MFGNGDAHKCQLSLLFLLLSTGNPEVKRNRVRSTRSLHSSRNKYRKSLSSRVMHVVMEVYLSLGRREKKEIRAGFTRRW